MAGWLTWRACGGSGVSTAAQRRARPRSPRRMAARRTHRCQVQLFLRPLRAHLQQVVAQDLGGALEHGGRGGHLGHERLLAGRTPQKRVTRTKRRSARARTQRRGTRRAALPQSLRRGGERIGARRAAGRHAPWPCRQSARLGPGTGRPPWAHKSQSRCPPGWCTRPPWRRPRASPCAAARRREQAAQPEAPAATHSARSAPRRRGRRPPHAPSQRWPQAQAPAKQPCWHAWRWERGKVWPTFRRFPPPARKGRDSARRIPQRRVHRVAPATCEQ